MVCGVKNVYPQRHFYVIVASPLDLIIELANQQRLVTTSSLPSEILRIKADEDSLYPPRSITVSPVSVVYYKAAPEHLHKKRKYKTVQQTDDNHPNNE